MRATILFVLALGLAGCSAGDGKCAAFAVPKALPVPAGEGGICHSDQCAAGLCRYVARGAALSNVQICGAACGGGVDCAAGHACMPGLTGADAGICVATCSADQDCASSVAEESCELTGDDAGTRVCVPHSCVKASQCGSAFQCQSDNCPCSGGGFRCSSEVEIGYCRRK